VLIIKFVSLNMLCNVSLLSIINMFSAVFTTHCVYLESRLTQWVRETHVSNTPHSFLLLYDARNFKYQNYISSNVYEWRTGKAEDIQRSRKVAETVSSTNIGVVIFLMQTIRLNAARTCLARFASQKVIWILSFYRAPLRSAWKFPWQRAVSKNQSYLCST
jgi:hypothetical protein